MTRELNTWVYGQALRTLPLSIESLSSQLGETYNRMTIKRQKTVWGSCSRKRNINLNQNLLFLPVEMVNYVLFHELSHLEHLNHQQGFWDLLESRFKGSRQMGTQVRNARSFVPDWAQA
jgi:predicted metal-dependent hydrolase